MALSDLINQSEALYYARFKDTAGTINYCVVILQDSYGGSSSEIPVLGAEPLIVRHKAVKDSHIKGTEVILNIVCESSDFDDYDDLTQGEEFEYEMLVYDESEESWPVWRGFISPGNLSRAYFDNISTVSISATDYLAKLKNIEFNDPYGMIPTTRTAALELIGWILGNLSGFVGLYVQNSLIETNFTVNPALRNAYVYPKIFAKLKNGIVVGDSCYDVLNYLGRTFNFIISSPFVKAGDIPATGVPRFFVTHNENFSAPFYWCAYSGLTFTSYTLVSITPSIDIDLYKFSRDSEYNRDLPVKSLNLVQHNYDFGETFTTDDFSDMDDPAVWLITNISPFTESGGIYSGTVAANTLGTMRTYSAYTLTNPEGNKYISVRFKIKNTTTYVSYLPNLAANAVNNTLSVKVRIIETAGIEIINHDELVIPVWCGATLTYQSPINANFEINPSSTYMVNIMIENSTSARAKTFEISEMEINTIYGSNGATLYNVMFDNVFEGLIESVLTSDKKLEIKLGDSDAERNASAITYSTDDDDITSDWTRYGKGESKSIQELVIQSFFNRYGGYARELKLRVHDPDNNINLHKFILFDSNTYFIHDFEKDIKSSWINLRLGKIQTTDITISVLKKFSVESAGNSSSGSGGSGSPVVSSVGISDHGLLSGLGDNDHPIYKLKQGTMLNYDSDGDELERGKSYFVDTNGGAFEVLLTSPSVADKMCFYFENVGDTKTFTLDGDGDTIDGSATKVFGAAYLGKLIVVVWNDTDAEWKVIEISLTDHGGLSGLSDDDHSQYHNDTRGDARYYTQAQLDGGQLDSIYYTETEVDGMLVTDHGELTGRNDDDHTQYHNDTRGDARYYTQAQLNGGQLDSRYYTETEVDALIKWQASGSDIYYNSGNIAVGTSSPDSNSKIKIKQASDAYNQGLNIRDSSDNYSGYIWIDGNYFKFQWGSTTTALSMDSSGYIFLPSIYSHTTADSANLVINAGGSLFRSTSSRKIKKNIKYNVDPLLALKFKPVSFECKNTGRKLLGFIAEDLAEIDKRFVTGGKLPGLEINAILAAQNATIIQQQKEIESLTDEVSNLKNEIEKIKNHLKIL